jgi:hypothetical protein
MLQLILVGIKLKDIKEIRIGYLVSFVDCSIIYPRIAGGRTMRFVV